MKASVYDQTGKEIKQSLLPKEIFEVKINTDLVHQVVQSQTANRRRTIAHVKDRGAVRGGGRKPWRQKGTGRARHGSTRSPIWIGGGVTFGPTKEKVFKQKVNAQMKRRALFMVLTAKAQNNLVLVLEGLKLDGAKTKTMAQLMAKLPVKGATKLIVAPGMDKNLILSSRNLVNTKILQAKDLNVLDVLSSKYLIVPRESLDIMKETFLKK